MEEIEQEQDEGGGVAVRRGLDHAEGGDAVGAHAAELPVEIGLCSADRCQGIGDRRVFLRPVEPGAGEELHRAVVEPRMHAVAVEFDFMQPLVALRRRVDQLGQLRRDPLRQSRGAWTARYRPRYAGGGNGLLRRRMRLLGVIASRRHAWDDTTASKLASSIVSRAVATNALSARELECDSLPTGQDSLVPGGSDRDERPR
jgi:hypothetical protein